ncbi:MAG: ATP-dependent Clp protease adaptor ClpS [Chlorobium sp.]
MNLTLGQHWRATIPGIGIRKRELLSGQELLDAYRVLLFNDEAHTFDEVINQLMKALRCSRHKAEKHTWEVHTRGRSIVYAGSMFACLQVSSVLEEIALKTEIQTI